MINDVQALVDRYWSWLRDKTALRSINDWVEITTPFLDRHNDYIQIYAKRRDAGILLTDDGYTLHDLEQSGCELTTPKRRELLNLTLGGFGVRQVDKSLQVHATTDDFALRKHNLVQAMLAVGDLFYLAQPMVASVFYEDVVAWLDLSDIRYTPRVKFTGQTGYDHVFDFVIPKSRTQPERIVHAINRPSRDTAEKMAFAWVDIKQTRPAEARAYAILNDTEHPVPETVLDAMRNYDVRPIAWSQREQVREELVA